MLDAKPLVIVVGIDYSTIGNRALAQALEVASLHQSSEVHVLHVDAGAWRDGPQSSLEKAIDADAAVRQVQKHAAELVAAMPANLDRTRIRRVVAHIRSGSPAVNIAQLAADLDADLVVVGSHGHRGLERFFLGSVAERVSRLARCPVWIVRPKDHSIADRVPEIEPPCPECLTKRRETGGAELWCSRHSEHHLAPHRYSYSGGEMYSPETAAYASLPQRGA
jgi:nucleotide-binding universal stress UspA family protein